MGRCRCHDFILLLRQGETEERRGGRGKDGDTERLRAGVGGRLEGMQRWRWGGGQMQQLGADWKGVCAGEEGVRQSQWGYILCFMVTGGRINHCFIKRP